MKLRRIELQGFKSFRRKTGFPVGEGITAVVGPNGCGKSNIVDAIRWAMGTQSARSLRGTEMADVIFAGSESKKKSGLAQVELTFENHPTSESSPDDLASSPLRTMVAQAATLTVGRRLQRAGSAEYLLNGSPVRLKDVQELFLGTGASVRGYSIIEQGQIDFLVNARPSERRGFVEELAGVTRYKFHRKETQSKMAATRANLERLSDLVDEVKRRLGQLKRQALVARKHETLAERRRNLRLFVLVEQRAQVDTQRHDQARALETASAERDAATGRLSDAEALGDALSARLSEARSQVEGLTEDVYRSQAKRDLLRQSVEHAQREAERLVSDSARLAEDEKELAEEIQGLDARLTELDQEIAATPVDEQGGEPLESRVAEATAVVSSAERVLDRATTDLTSVATRQAELRTSLKGRREEAARLEGQLAGSETKRGELEAAARAKEVERIRADAEREARATELSRAFNTVGAAKKAEAQVRVELDSGRAALEPIERALAGSRARLIAKREAHGETRAGAVERVLEAARDGVLSGVLGQLAAGIDVPPHLDGAVFGVLRHLLEYVVVADDQAAARVIRFAVDQDLVVGCIERRPEAAGPRTGGLLDRLTLADWVPVSVRHLLSGAEVGEIFEPGRSPEGFLVDETGNCRSGSGFWHSTDPHGGELARRMRLEREIGELEAGIDNTQQERHRQQVIVEQATARVSAARRALEDAEEQALSAREELSQHERIVARHKGDLQALTARLGEHEQRTARELERADELAVLVKQAEAGMADLAGERSSRESERDAARGRVEAARAELSAAQQALSEHRERVRQRRTQAQGLHKERERTTDRRDRARDRVARHRERRAQNDDLAARRRTEAQANAATATRLDGEMVTLRAALEEANTVASVLQEEARRHATMTRELQQTALALGARVERLDVEHGQAARELERLEADLSRLGMTPIEARALLEGFDPPDQPDETLAAIQREIERLGPVNHAAVDELAEAEERLDFLQTQQADLVDAMGDMKATIEELDRASREAFLATFQRLRGEFEVLFTRLFQGGEGTLVLSDDSDPLNAGVDVIVAPPGKKVRSMTLLSGGEKALTAIAMVFSAFRLKSSPFCVLDEVDAPLDDANVERFVDLIEEMSDTIQFLVVTHNRRTMECADALVGVTMDEPGVSRLVGVTMPEKTRPQPASDHLPLLDS